jgi:hypothetical protein
MLKSVLTASAVLLLTGCGAVQELAALRAARDDATCRSYGFQPGSEAFAQCRMAVDQNRMARMHSEDRQPQEQAGYMPIPAPTFAPARIPPVRQTSCTVSKPNPFAPDRIDCTTH